MRKPCIAAILLVFSLGSIAQEKSPIKFGKISPEEIKVAAYTVDSNAAAIIIVDRGISKIVGNNKGWFSIEQTVFRRVHVLKKSGYDAANFEVVLYGKDGLEEKLENLKAITYNFENGKIVETKLDKGAVFTEKRTKNLTAKKFTLPNVKEGSVIDVEYQLSSDYLFNLQPWEFQGEYPRLWSEYSVMIPEFLDYVFLSQGYQRFHSTSKKDNVAQFNITDNSGAMRSERYSFTAGVTTYKWAMKDVPTLKEESFTTTLANHIARIGFQLSGYKHPLIPKSVMSTWPGVAEELLKRDDFGLAIGRDNGWLGDIVKPITEGQSTDIAKAKGIYEYVRNNYSCTRHYGVYLDQTLKNTAKSKAGNVAEINMLLIAMLRYAGLRADPVLLSTRSHGYSYEMYPLLDKFNYLVCQLMLDDKSVLLDASYNNLAFGKLTPDAFNGHARIINNQATPVYLYADSVRERSMTTVFLSFSEEGKLKGNFQKTPGYYESYRIRNKIKEIGKEGYAKEIEKGYGSDIHVLQPAIDSLEKLDRPVVLKYGLLLDNNDESIMYINPMMAEGYKENPFKSAERLYPVEMPFTIDDTYLFNFIVPVEYEVDELPKSMLVKLNEQNEGSFEYRLQQNGQTIQMRCRIKLDKAYFTPDEYELLREFFNIIVEKQSEQIVLKKKS